MKERGGIHNRSNAAQENHAKHYGEIMHGDDDWSIGVRLGTRQRAPPKRTWQELAGVKK
jgi:hypothetical protein